MTWRPRIVGDGPPPPVVPVAIRPPRVMPAAWYEKFAAGCAEGRERQKTRRERAIARARLFEQTQRIRVERERRIRELLDLDVWWDGPGSEGRIA